MYIVCCQALDAWIKFEFMKHCYNKFHSQSIEIDSKKLYGKT